MIILNVCFEILMKIPIADTDVFISDSIRTIIGHVLAFIRLKIPS